MEIKNLIQPANELAYAIENMPKVVEALYCPMTKKPFKNAQSVDCGQFHVFDLEVIENIFNQAQINQSNSIVCPLCKGRITFYHPNSTVQSLVNFILRNQKVEIQMKQMEETLRKIKIEFENSPKYPLEKDSFKLNFETTFKEDHPEVILDNTLMGPSLKNSKISSMRILRISLEMMILKNEPTYRATIFLTNEKNKLALKDFFEKNHVRMQMGSGIELLEIYWSRDCKLFLACIQLLEKNLDFDDEAQEAVKKLIDTINQ